MNAQRLVATGIFLLVVVWVFFPRGSTSLDNQSAAEEEPAITVISASDPPTGGDVGFTVRATRINAQKFVENVRVRGRTQAFRSVDVKAEQSGRIVAIPAERGSRVQTGDPLCEISIDTREADLLEAESRRDQTRFEYDAAQDLRNRGLQSAVAVAQAKAAYDSAIAMVERARLALENTTVRAPFDGIVEARPVEIGDFLERGSVCATVLDVSPMLLVGLVPEQDIGKLVLGAPVSAELLTGEKVDGRVTYLARNAEDQSRSYRMEAEVTGAPIDIRAGITTELLVAAAEINAHLIPASSLTLDDEGEVGVKLLDAQNIVQFVRVTLVGDETSLGRSGVWVTGLPAQSLLITHGQEIVFPGQRVQSALD